MPWAWPWKVTLTHLPRHTVSPRSPDWSLPAVTHPCLAPGPRTLRSWVIRAGLDVSGGKAVTRAPLLPFPRGLPPAPLLLPSLAR